MTRSPSRIWFFPHDQLVELAELAKTQGISFESFVATNPLLAGIAPRPGPRPGIVVASADPVPRVTATAPGDTFARGGPRSGAAARGGEGGTERSGAGATQRGAGGGRRSVFSARPYYTKRRDSNLALPESKTKVAFGRTLRDAKRSAESIKQRVARLEAEIDEDERDAPRPFTWRSGESEGADVDAGADADVAARKSSIARRVAAAPAMTMADEDEAEEAMSASPPSRRMQAMLPPGEQPKLSRAEQLLRSYKRGHPEGWKVQMAAARDDVVEDLEPILPYHIVGDDGDVEARQTRGRNAADESERALAADWFILDEKSGRVLGPSRLESLAQWFVEGHLSADSLVTSSFFAKVSLNVIVCTAQYIRCESCSQFDLLP